MKPLSELRSMLDFHPHEQNSTVAYFSQVSLNWDVYLKSYGMCLQRGFVWNKSQKRELIWSILMRRHIPRMAIIFTIDDVYEIIDGKQRLGAMLGFYYGEFSLEYEGKEYYYKDLPIEHQKAIGQYHFAYMVYNEEHGKKLTDDQRVAWFKYINFAGTAQDSEHMDKLKKQAQVVK